MSVEYYLRFPDNAHARSSFDRLLEADPELRREAKGIAWYPAEGFAPRENAYPGVECHFSLDSDGLSIRSPTEAMLAKLAQVALLLDGEVHCDMDGEPLDLRRVAAHYPPGVEDEEEAEPDEPALLSYSPRTKFKQGDLVDHPKFGLGTVQSVAAKSMTVAFDDGERKLVQGL